MIDNIVETNNLLPANACVIWMHGLGAAGVDFLSIPFQFNLPHCYCVKFIFPDAPVMPVTVNNGLKMQAWYNIKCFNSLAFNPNDPTNHEGIDSSEEIIIKLINQAIQNNIPTKRIILAGFSQGGVMALYTGLKYKHKLGGIISLSGYLAQSDLLKQQNLIANQNTPIFMAHGLFDPVVPFHLGKQSYEFLQSLNYTINWHTYSMPHTIIEEEIIDLGKFFRTILGD